jgi:8-oxoguanine deaminase
MLIRNAAAIMTGLPGAAARVAGPDLRFNSQIEEIGRLAPRSGERVVDATDCVVYPGWVNTHHHLAQSVLKGVPQGINLPLLSWLESVPYRYRARFDAGLLELAAEIGMTELMLSGCTTLADHHYVYWKGIDYDPAKILFDLAARFGLRFVL